MAITGTISLTGINAIIKRPFDVAGVKRRVTFDYQGPPSYATGGDGPVTPATDIGDIATIDYWPDMTGFTAAGAVVAFVFNYGTNKIQAFNYTTGAEIGAATNLSAYVARFEVAGR